MVDLRYNFFPSIQCLCRKNVYSSGGFLGVGPRQICHSPLGQDFWDWPRNHHMPNNLERHRFYPLFGFVYNGTIQQNYKTNIIFPFSDLFCPRQAWNFFLSRSSFYRTSSSVILSSVFNITLLNGEINWTSCLVIERGRRQVALFTFCNRKLWNHPSIETARMHKFEKRHKALRSSNVLIYMLMFCYGVSLVCWHLWAFESKRTEFSSRASDPTLGWHLGIRFCVDNTGQSCWVFDCIVTPRGWCF